MRRTLLLVALTLFIAPLAVRAQSTADASGRSFPTPSTSEATPKQTCGFAYGNACGAPEVQKLRSARVQVMMHSLATGCPVGFYAGHSDSLTQLRADEAIRGVSQSLNVRMDNSSPRDIVSAQITVHGLSQRSRLTPAEGVRSDLTKHIELNLAVDAGKHSAKDVRIYGFTSIQRIDLDSLTYADGTTWTASDGHHCSVVPNGLMLVAASQ
jgi:hypothetical protein